MIRNSVLLTNSQVKRSMLHVDELKNTLSKLARPNEADLAKLDSLCTFREFSKNEFLLQQQELARYSAFIVDGAFREYYADKNGREYNKAFCFKGDFTGSYYDLESKRPSTVSIQALTDSAALMMMHDEYVKLAHTSMFWSQVAYLFTKNLLMRKFEKEYQLLTLSAEERYAVLQAEHPELERLVPAYHIASYLGITPISLSRIRAQRRG